MRSEVNVTLDPMIRLIGFLSGVALHVYQARDEFLLANELKNLLQCLPEELASKGRVVILNSAVDVEL